MSATTGTSTTGSSLKRGRGGTDDTTLIPASLSGNSSAAQSSMQEVEEGRAESQSGPVARESK